VLVTRAVLVVAFALSLGCSRQSPVAEHRPEADGADAHSPVATEKAAARPFALDMEGQLDRAKKLFGDPTFEGAAAGELGMWKDKEPQVARLREVSGVTHPSADPRAILWIAVHADGYCKSWGGITYAMLTKNADRSAGRPWFIMNAKILEIFEDHEVSMARMEMDPGEHPIFVKWRYLTDFVAGDRVDVVGFWAGSQSYKARIGEIIIPALAAAAVLKPGTIKAMNKISRVWLGDVGPNQLRMTPRKL
jgi:hypothetical protein